MNFKQFGGKITEEDIKRYQQSPNWMDGAFQNLEETELTPSLWKVPGMIYKQLSTKKRTNPALPLPVVPFQKTDFMAASEEAKFIWYGHAALLMQINGKTLLVDPMLGPDTTPIAPIANKRFSENTLSLIDDFPPIDLVLFTHDHYDHLDYASIQKLKSKVKHFYVALGVKRHLVAWGINGDRITEFDWWESHTFEAIKITFTPTQHFSGRGLRDRQKSLWGGWVFEHATEKIWFSGDGGYGNHFQEIGKRLGPFDFGFMECGQYNHDWHPVHLFPDESVQAAMDAGVSKIMAYHWGGFALSYQHDWEEPMEDFMQSALQHDIPFLAPAIGQSFTKSSSIDHLWWREF